MLIEGPLSDELEAFLSSCIDQSGPLFGLDQLETDISHAEGLGSDASTAVQQQSPQYASKEGHHTRSDSSEKCANTLQGCLQMISSLEEQLHDRTPSVDEVMQISKTCAEELSASMQLDWFRRGTAGPMLILTAAEQITLLFESSIPSLVPTIDKKSPTDVQAPTADGDIPNRSRARYPSLTLGNFQADPEEAGLIWQHIFSGELRRFLHLVEAIREKPGFGNERGLQSNSRQRLCDGLKQRIKTMITSIRDLREGSSVDMF